MITNCKWNRDNAAIIIQALRPLLHRILPCTKYFRYTAGSFRNIRSFRVSFTVMAVPTVQLYNGHKFPILALGTYNAGCDEVTQAIKDAIDIGYRSFDCAFRYGNEKEIGAGLRAKIDDGVIKREDIFVTSKLWNTHHRPDLVIQACQKTLSDLGLDYLDLYLMHFPFAVKEGDELKPLDETGRLCPSPSDVDFVDTWKIMEECVKRGLVRSIGLSNFNSHQVERILSIAEIKPAVHQFECHIYLNQSKLIDFCKTREMVVMGYCPLGSPGSSAKPDTPPLLLDPRLVALSIKYNKTPAQIVLRYLIQHGIIPLPKSVNKEHQKENINIFNFELTTEDKAYLDTFDEKIRIVRVTEARNLRFYPFNVEF